MKLAVLAMAGLIAATTSANAARVEFRGGLCVVSLSTACTAVDETTLGFCYQMRYSPPNLGDNGPATRLSILEYGGAQNYTLPTGSLIGTGFKSVQGTGVYRVGYTFTSTMRITSQTPSDPSTANVVTITGISATSMV